MACGTSPMMCCFNHVCSESASCPRSRARFREASLMRHMLARPGDSRSAISSTTAAVAASSGPGASSVMSPCAMSCETSAGTSCFVASTTSPSLRSACRGVDAELPTPPIAPTNAASAMVASISWGEKFAAMSGTWNSNRASWSGPAYSTMRLRACLTSGLWVGSERRRCSGVLSVRQGEASQPARRIAHWSASVASNQERASWVAASTSASSVLPRPRRPADSPVVMRSAGSKPRACVNPACARTPREPSLFSATGDSSNRSSSWRSLRTASRPAPVALRSIVG